MKGVLLVRPSNVTTVWDSAGSQPKLTGRWIPSLSSVDGGDLVERRVLAAVLPEELRRVHRLEALRLEVDDVDLARRVAQDLVGGHVDTQPRLAGRDEDG